LNEIAGFVLVLAGLRAGKGLRQPRRSTMAAIRAWWTSFLNLGMAGNHLLIVSFRIGQSSTWVGK